MFVVTVKLSIDLKHVEEFHTAVLKQAATSLAQEEGCRQFDVSVSAENPSSVFLYELYDDAAAFDRHLASDHFLSFDRQVRAWVSDKTVNYWIRRE